MAEGRPSDRAALALGPLCGDKTVGISSLAKPPPPTGFKASIWPGKQVL